MTPADDRQSPASHLARPPKPEDATLLEYLPAAAFVASNDGRIFYANTAWQRLAQARYETLAALSAQRLRRADGLPYAPGASPLERVLRCGRSLDDAEIHVVEADGRFGLWSVSTRPLPGLGTNLEPYLLVTAQPRPRRYSRRLVQAGEAARHLLSGRPPSLAVAVEAALGATCRRLRWRFAAVYVEEGGDLRQVAGWSGGEQAPPSMVRTARSAWHSGSGVWATVADASARRTMMAVPVRLGREVIGTAVWGGWCDRPRDPDMIAAMAEVADDIGRAVARDRSLGYLYRTESRLHSLVQFSPVPIVMLSRDEWVEVWNPAAERTYGWTAEEVLGGPLPFVPPDDPDYRAIVDGLHHGASFPKMLARRLRKDGSVIEVSVSAAPTFEADGRVDGSVAMHMDVSERTRFLQIAGHELRNPLATAKGLLSLARTRLEAGAEAEAVAGLLLKAEGQIDRTAVLLQEILEGFRVAAGHGDVAMRVTNLGEAVTRAAGEAIEAGEARPGSLRVSVLERDGLMVMGNGASLVRVVRALVSNAFKFSPEGGMVRVRVFGDASWANIVVDDEGIGVPRGQVEEVFQPFARGDNLSDRDPGGLGLGLYVCRDIVARHAGRIWLARRRPNGTRVQVQLPRYAGEVPE